jgi:acetolactate synthase small subunit
MQQFDFDDVLRIEAASASAQRLFEQRDRAHEILDPEVQLGRNVRHALPQVFLLGQPTFFQCARTFVGFLFDTRAPLAERTQVLQTAELFRARVVDVNPDTVTLEATGTPDKLQALLAVLAPLGIKEMAQSGTVSLGRGPRSMSGAGTLRPVERTD